MRTHKDIFKEEGFSVVEAEMPNKLLEFIKENHPNIISDNEIRLDELKAVLGLPIDEKVNGYGLNFIGRNVARSKYASETEKELKVNPELSKDFDTTQNMVLKGDNLDSLKLLKSHYSGKIKCIYIDPPYNTTNDEFVYPDKFDKEEAEVLGLANLSQDDMDRLEFSFGTKKSHNGWLSFMYPRLLLARDLLKEDGVIFISIDDNEQANLKLLCDEIFGEENFVGNFIVKSTPNARDYGHIGKMHEYVLFYTKNYFLTETSHLPDDEKKFIFTDEISDFNIHPLYNSNEAFHKLNRPNLFYPFYIDPTQKLDNGFYYISLNKEKSHFIEIYPPKSLKNNVDFVWRWGKNKSQENLNFEIVGYKTNNDEFRIVQKMRTSEKVIRSILDSRLITSRKGTAEIESLLGSKVFSFPKPIDLIFNFIKISTLTDDLILDFFAGSGTTGHAVMQLNAEDGGNRKFILCQIDEPIAKDKPAYQFCIDNNLEPVISSITIERLRRAGEKIKTEIEEENSKTGLFDENKKQVPDIGFKVFDTVESPKLALEDGKIAFPNTDNDTLSRIYNMIFSVGIDNPTSKLECVVEDCIYKIENHYYITNSEKVSNEDLSQAIKSGKVFIDGWTASLNATLQHYKEDVKIVF